MIEHDGVVQRVDRNWVRVAITSRSACGSCSARQACGLAEAQEKVVDVATERAAAFAPGDRVVVGVRSDAGARAVMVAYVGALAVLLVSLGLARIAGASEGWSIVVSLGAVALYYGAVWLLRRKIEHTIHFTITKS